MHLFSAALISPSALDLRLLLDLNAINPHNHFARAVFSSIATNSIVRGLPVFLVFVSLWFSSECAKRRSQMLTGLVAASIATLLSVWIQSHFTPHVRPLCDPTIPLRYVGLETWEHVGSFPSDTASLYFALATIIFLINRTAGGIAFLWSFLSAGIVRVAIGLHYPSDIAGGMILGSGFVLLFTWTPFFRSFFTKVLQRFEKRLYILHALMFVFLADAYSLFSGLHGVYHGLGLVGAYLVRQI